MDEVQLRALIRQFDTKDEEVQRQVWLQVVRYLREAAPLLVEEFPNIRKWQGRRRIVWEMETYAYRYPEAYELGLLAIRDKATLVRYRGCEILALAQRREALPHLQALLNHPDTETVADAKAAIDAIKHKKAVYFIDRTHSGHIGWNKG